MSDILDAMDSPSIGMFYVLNGEVSDVPLKKQSSLIIFKHNTVWMGFNSEIWTGETYIPVMLSQNVINGWVDIKTGEMITV